MAGLARWRRRPMARPCQSCAAIISTVRVLRECAGILTLAPVQPGRAIENIG